MRYRTRTLLSMILTIGFLGAVGNLNSIDARVDAPACPTSDTIASALGVKPEVNRTVNKSVIECRYLAHGGRTSILVKFIIDTNADEFSARKQEQIAHLPTTDIPGLLDEAYSSSETPVVEKTKIITVVARKGSTEILVTAPLSIGEEKTLIEKVAATLK